MDNNEEQPENAPESILVIIFPIITLLKLVLSVEGSAGKVGIIAT